MRIKLILLATTVVLGLEPPAVFAQPLEHRLHLSKYESALLAGFPLTLWAGKKLYHPDPSFREHDRGWKNPLDAAARAVLHNRLFQNHEKIPKVISDQLRNALLIYPLLYLPRKNHPTYEFHEQPFALCDDARFFLSYAEAHSATFFVTHLAKFISNRHRPWVAYQNFSSPLYKGETPERANVSFFSGHASTAFASASFHHRMLQRFQGKRLGDAEVWGVYLAAALTGVARISADKHYLTDVLTGAVVGTLVARWVVDLSDYAIIERSGIAPQDRAFPILVLNIAL